MDELTSPARAAGQGDRGALARLVQQAQGDVWRLCDRLVDPAAADDLAQDTYLRAIGSLGTFRGGGHLRLPGRHHPVAGRPGPRGPRRPHIGHGPPTAANGQRRHLKFAIHARPRHPRSH
jgi:hypothetical protein